MSDSEAKHVWHTTSSWHATARSAHVDEAVGGDVAEGGERIPTGAAVLEGRGAGAAVVAEEGVVEGGERIPTGAGVAEGRGEAVVAEGKRGSEVGLGDITGVVVASGFP